MGNKTDKLQSKEYEYESSTKDETNWELRSKGHKYESSTKDETHVERTKPGAGEIDVGDFRITIYPNIGQGSYGQVCKAVHLDTNTTVAAKGMKFAFGTDVDEKIRKMAVEEAKKMRMVHHQNIAGCFGFKLHLGTAWLFIEFCDLGDLENYMLANKEISLDLKLSIMQDITEAVAYLHNFSPSIIHGDIKPSNVLMKTIKPRSRPIPKLTDFGFAKLNQYSSSLTASISSSDGIFSAKGTPQYMASEMFLTIDVGFKYKPSVDIFSLE